MSFSLSQASLSTFDIALKALSAILDKAEAHAKAKHIDADSLLESRLAPDMFPLTRQIQIASDQAKRGAARLAEVEPPVFEDNEKTFDELRARIAKTLAFLHALDPRAIDAAADRDISFPLSRNEIGHMRGADYLTHFVLPNFYFHVVTAYDILRHNGVDLGKRDFLGAIPVKRA